MKMANRQQVIGLHKTHPEWTCGLIAKVLNCKPEYVACTIRRAGLKLPNSKGYKPLQKYVPIKERCARIAEDMGSVDIANAIRTRI